MEKLDYLIEYLLKESGRGKFDYSNRDKKSLYRALVNIRQANPISEDFLKVEDEFNLAIDFIKKHKCDIIGKELNEIELKEVI